MAGSRYPLCSASEKLSHMCMSTQIPFSGENSQIQDLKDLGSALEMEQIKVPKHNRTEESRPWFSIPK